MLQQGLKLETITCARQLGDHMMELLTKSYDSICEGLEAPLTEADLSLSFFNYVKFHRINVVEERLGRIIKQMNTVFRSMAKLEESVLQFSVSKGNIAFRKAIAAQEAQEAQRDGVPLPP